MQTNIIYMAELGTSVIVLIGVGSAIAGGIISVVLSKIVIGRTIGQARVEGQQILERAQADAANASEKIKLEAEKSVLDRKERFESDMEQARSELREGERRLAKREDLFDRKEEALSLKDASLAKASTAQLLREEKLAKNEEELEGIIQEQKRQLLQVSSLTQAEATERVLRRVEEESRLEVAKVVRKINEEAELEAKENAREVTLMAIQRYATEHTSESTVRTVQIPSDDMKGRIIGREGRNIRAIERATGVDIIVDDTPGVIVVSCFDKVRQAVAVESLNRLIADGRMHPARIEEIVEKVSSEMGQKIIKLGKDATLEANLRGLHPKIVEAMGKLHFRTSFGQNILRHSLEVSYLSQIIADQLGMDGALARRCGFLHDIGKAMDHEMEGTHPQIGMAFAKQFGEKDPVLNVIGGHHGDIPATNFYTPIIMAADAVSSARPGARRESMEKYIQRLTELQEIALNQRGVTEAYAIQAGREVRVMVDAAKVNDDEAHLIANDIAKLVSEQMTFPGEIKVTVLRETRAVEYAR